MNIGDWLPVMATFSACWQNNHHHYPHLLRTTHAPGEFDFGYMTVRVMSALGLVKPSGDRRRTSHSDSCSPELTLYATPRSRVNGATSCAKKPLRHFAANQAVALGPGVFRKILGPEQPIDEREVDGEVDVHRVLVRRVMPVVIAHGHEIRLHPDRPRPEVGVAERRVEGHEDQVTRQRGLRETEDASSGSGSARASCRMST